MKLSEYRALVGYEQRLHRMTRAQLLAEATDLKLVTKPMLIRLILDAQGIDDEVLKGGGV